MKKIFYVLVLVILALGLTGCDEVTLTTVEIDGITLDTDTLQDSYDVDTLNLSDLKLIVSYDDETSKKIQVKESMLGSDDLEKLKSPGTYTVDLTYEGNTVEITITIVEVVSASAPVITRTGDANIDVEYGGIYTEPGATCADDVDTECIVVVGGDIVDTMTLGTYTVTYNAVDSESNNAAQITRTVFVKDTMLPTLNDIPQTQTIFEGTTLDLLMLGLTAQDNHDGDITESIMVNHGDTERLAVGKHLIIYTVQDSSGNDSSVTIELFVEALVFGLGDTIIFDDLEIYFASTEVREVDNKYSDYEEAVLVGVEIKNNASEVHSLNQFYHDGFGPDGIELNAIGSYFDTAVDDLGDTLPNAVMIGHLVYEYTGDGIYTIVFSQFLGRDINVKVSIEQSTITNATNTSEFSAYSPNPDFTESTYHIGDTILFDGLAIFFKSSHVKLIDNEYSDYEKAVLIEVEVKNISGEVHSLNQFYHDGFGPDGLETNQIGSYFDSAIDDLGNMLPNALMKGHLVYEYKEDGTYTVAFSELFGEGIYIEIEADQLNKIETSNTSSLSAYEPDLDFEESFIGVSEVFVFDELEIIVLTTTVELIDNAYADYEKAVLIEITVKNMSDEAHSLNMFYHDCYGPDGLEVKSIGSYFDSAIDYMGDVLPGYTLTGHLVYEYREDGSYVIEFDNYSEGPFYIEVQVAE